MGLVKIITFNVRLPCSFGCHGNAGYFSVVIKVLVGWHFGLCSCGFMLTECEVVHAINGQHLNIISGNYKLGRGVRAAEVK